MVSLLFAVGWRNQSVDQKSGFGDEGGRVIKPCGKESSFT